MKKYLKFFAGWVILHLVYTVDAQKMDTLFAKKIIDYPTYIELVGRNNLEYSAGKFNVNIAEADVLSAKVFPDPELAGGFFDNGEQRMDMGYGFSAELSWVLEFGGKRKERINLANDNVEMKKSLLEDYFRNLRADATLAYLETIRNRHLLDVQLDSYQQMKKLSEADSIRFKLGAITEIDARKSKLEARALLNEVYAVQAEWKNALTNLSLLLGERKMDTLWEPRENLTGFNRDFKLPDLIQAAQNNRTDLKAALQSKNVSHSIVKLAEANRAIDLGLSVGAEHNSYARNVIAPTPAFTTVRVGVSVPLKFSNNRPGELRAAHYGIKKAEQQYKQVEVVIQTEVTQAFYNYQATQKQVFQFDMGLLAEAKAILDGKMYSYERGETSLLEVLDAQRTYNEVQQNYYQTLYSRAVALVELERVVGVWDINFVQNANIK